ncbi:hypothetical protein [Aquabacterium sp. OR-4]|uniref:hypothetical protein n=1 Tax=Aquabacterium sp. OR-4 TaxID=2978127 RepID=UPI0021B15C76|nr:hypothetical protein [Aquabacterium sp. OR-4]MDT7834372.1 hypothetical protein [Aquabacterium sp. OR-4]
MATVRPSALQGTTALELNGQFAGWLRSLQPPGYQLSPVVVPAGPGAAARLAAQVAITEMAAEFTLGGQGALLDWALSLPEARPEPVAGAALVLDARGRVARRIAWSEGLITALQLPTLDAASKLPFSIGLRWQPGTVAYPKAEGSSPPGAVAGSRKGPMLANFRVGGLPFDSRHVLRVALPTVTATLAEEAYGVARLPARHRYSIDLGEVQLDFLASARDELLAWVGKVIADGLIADSDYLTLAVELLDPAMKKVLGTITLHGCSLLDYAEAPLGQASDALPTVSLRFGVGQFAMAMAS